MDQAGNKTIAPNLACFVLDALDLVGAGVLITSIHGRILWANRAANEILNTRDGLEVGAEDILHLSNDDCAFPIEEMLNADGDIAGTDSCVNHVRRSGKCDLTVIVRPTSNFGDSRSSERPAALVFIQDPDQAIQVPQSDLHQLYGLTIAEGRMANCLMEGRTLEECCNRLAVRASTARMHLRNLLSKTGTRSQGELVWLLFRNFGFISSARVRDSFLTSRTVTRGPSSSSFRYERVSPWE